jgi:hypothetical protein
LKIEASIGACTLAVFSVRQSSGTRFRGVSGVRAADHVKVCAPLRLVVPVCPKLLPPPDWPWPLPCAAYTGPKAFLPAVSSRSDPISVIEGFS